jgi:hypothetical protein
MNRGVKTSIFSLKPSEKDSLGPGSYHITNQVFPISKQINLVNSAKKEHNSMFSASANINPGPGSYEI